MLVETHGIAPFLKYTKIRRISSSSGSLENLPKPVPHWSFVPTKRTRIRSTTILCVRRDGKVVMAGDGQVTLGSEVLKAGAKKLRRLYNGKIIAGFAGATADAFALFTRFETKL